jgi:hypothetical protein
LGGSSDTLSQIVTTQQTAGQQAVATAEFTCVKQDALCDEEDDEIVSAPSDLYAETSQSPHSQSPRETLQVEIAQQTSGQQAATALPSIEEIPATQAIEQSFLDEHANKYIRFDRNSRIWSFDQFSSNMYPVRRRHGLL